MKYTFLIITFLSFVLVSNSQISDTDIYSGIEFDMPKVSEPEIPNLSVSLMDFGGKGDGKMDNSEVFEKAIAAVSAKGGGKVIVPRGIWLTGPITLKSNLNIHLEDGSLIVFSSDFDKYPLKKTSFEGLETYRCISPINGEGLQNVAITGTGTIDGSGGSWRPVKKDKLTSSQWSKLVRSGGVVGKNDRIWYPSEKSRLGAEGTGNFNVPSFTNKEDFEAVKDFLRPVMVSIVNSKNVMFDGPTFQNSPAWNLHPLMCENVIIRNINVRNPWFSQNGDGLDLESCKNALIYNNTFDVGDDAICIKSGKNEDGRKRGMPTENVIIKNNIVYHGHGGFVVGSEMSGGVKNIHVSKCTFIGTDTGLRFKSTRGRGGIVENIYISDIDMINIPTEPIRFNLFYGGQSPILEDDQEAPDTDVPEVPVTEETPSFKDIYIKNVNAVGCKTAGYFQGLPEMNLKNINLQDVTIEAENGISIIDADGISMKNVNVSVKKGYTLTLFNVRNTNIKDLKMTPEGKGVKVLGKKTSDVSISGVSNDRIEKGKEVNKKSLIIK